VIILLDLTFEYLIVFILLFSTNLGLLARAIDLNKNNFYIFSIIYGVIIFVFAYIASIIGYQSSIVEYIPYILGLVCILVLIFTVLHLLNWRRVDDGKNYLVNKFVPIAGIILSSFIAIFSFSLVFVNNNMFNTVELAILAILIMILVYFISKIFTRAKRPFPVVIGEFMFLEFILLLILGLTFNVVRELDYSMFSSFLILTPTYQVLYMVLALAIIIVLGVLYNNEKTLKDLKRK